MKWLRVLLLFPLFVVAQEPAAKAPAEGTLTIFTDRNAKDVPTQVNRLTQEVFMLKTELNVLTFRQEYGDRIKMQRVSFPANTADKEAIPAYLFTPAGLAAGKKLPALVMVHGGNHIQLTHEWFPWIAEAVRRGYAVIYPEYRGSSGHDETIYENNYGVTDVADVLAAAAYFAKKDYVDATRLGIFGHSRGGMITLSAIEKEPKRFKAAINVAGLSDLVAFMGYKTDARRQDIASQKNFGGKLPDKNLPAYIDVSPAFAIEKIETPVLLLSTTGDKTVPYQLHNKRVAEALKAYGKVFESHLYELAPGGHEFLNVDSDEGRDCMKRSFEWFAKYLTP
ncbi:MAG: S9 family peptidase [Verrucomicrobia bacterium]|nr:S9 family peptidase [Verrucomicrobiota bacterium]